MKNQSVKQTGRLSLKRETITRLNSDHLKNVVGGIEHTPITKLSCAYLSCNSAAGAGSCSDNSCACTGNPDRP